jgi:ankyrin repeat protein
VQLGEDVNAADNYGIIPLMVAAKLGEVPIIQYLIDQGADLGTHDRYSGRGRPRPEDSNRKPVDGITGGLAVTDRDKDNTQKK